MLPSNSNKVVKEVSIKKVSGKKKHQQNYLVHYVIRKSQQRKQRQEKLPAKQKYKRNSKNNIREETVFISWIYRKYF